MYRVNNKDYKGVIEKENKQMKNLIVVFDNEISNERLSLLDKVNQVVGYEFVGDPKVLNNIQQPKKEMKVFIENVDILGLGMVINRYPSWVTLVIKAEDLHMYDVYFLCQRHKNVRVCGSYLFQLDGCRVGCGYKEIKDSIVEGCSCGVQDLVIEDDIVFKEFSFKSSAEKEGNKSSRKQQKKSVISRLVEGEGASF